MSLDRNSKSRKRQSVPADPPKTREEIEVLHGEVWSTEELGRTFIVTAILGSTLVVRRKSDNAVGTVEIQKGPPQLYYKFTPQQTAE